jgi:hypothetical protein
MNELLHDRASQINPFAAGVLRPRTFVERFIPRSKLQRKNAGKADISDRRNPIWNQY